MRSVGFRRVSCSTLLLAVGAAIAATAEPLYYFRGQPRAWENAAVDVSWTPWTGDAPLPLSPDELRTVVESSLRRWSSRSSLDFRLAGPVVAAAPRDCSELVEARFPAGISIVFDLDGGAQPLPTCVQREQRGGTYLTGNNVFAATYDPDGIPQPFLRRMVTLVDVAGVSSALKNQRESALGALEDLLVHELAHAAGLEHSFAYDPRLEGMDRPWLAPVQYFPYIHLDDDAAISAMYPPSTSGAPRQSYEWIEGRVVDEMGEGVPNVAVVAAAERRESTANPALDAGRWIRLYSAVTRGSSNPIADVGRFRILAQEGTYLLLVESISVNVTLGADTLPGADLTRPLVRQIGSAARQRVVVRPGQPARVPDIKVQLCARAGPDCPP